MASADRRVGGSNIGGVLFGSRLAPRDDPRKRRWNKCAGNHRRELDDAGAAAVDERSAGEVADEFGVKINVVYLVKSRLLQADPRAAGRCSPVERMELAMGRHNITDDGCQCPSLEQLEAFTLGKLPR